MDLAPTAERPVAAALEVRPLGGNRYDVIVHVHILEGWHAYDAVPEDQGFPSMSLELQLPEGLEQESPWVRPDSRPDENEEGVTLFEGHLAFRCVLKGGDVKGEVVCRLAYQVCSDDMCLAPSVDVLRVAIGAP